MKKDFVIDQSNALLKKGALYDLHNLYDYRGLELFSESLLLKISFVPNKDFGSGPAIRLIFEGLDFFEASSGAIVLGLDTLDEIGYKSPGDFDDNWLMSEEQSNPKDHLFLRLERSHFIRVHSEYAKLTTF